ncbi:MAG: hypothetical protein WCR06_05420 [bacterium]
MTYQTPSALARMILALGVARRMCLHWFRPGYIRASHALRQGECQRCGACCRLTLTCRHVCEEQGLASCNRHKQTRLPNCVNFPIDPRDLADRNRIAPDVPCGFMWHNSKKAEDNISR